MNVFVRVIGGPDVGRTIPLRAGQVARFGRTEWADFGFPADGDLGEVHFELRCGPMGEVVLRNLAAAGTLVDGVPVAESALRPGQRVSAGRTIFSITFEPGAGSGSPSGSNGTRATLTQLNGPAPIEDDATVAAICARFEPEADAQQLAATAASPADYVTTLITRGHLRDALRFQAFRLPKRHAVWWAWRCLTEPSVPPGPPGCAEALDAAHGWIVKPNDETARKAGAAAESLGYGPAAAWTAAAAFWSGDNIAPPVTSAVAPPDHLTGTAVSAAMLLGSIAGDPAATTVRQKMFLDLADRILRGEDGPPELDGDGR